MKNGIPVNILGTIYKVFFNGDEDSQLECCDGYTDYTVNHVVVRKEFEDNPRNLYDLEVYQRNVLLHELVHAFLNESGLRDNSWAAEEEIVDWIAIQLPKIMEAYNEIDERYKGWK